MEREDFDTMISRLPLVNFGQYKTSSKWQLLKQLYDYNFVLPKSDTTKIPKIIHQIWLGSNMPEKYKVWAESWKKLNPDYEYHLWTDLDIAALELPNQENFDTILNNGPRSDVLRYHILNKFGGVYVDTDFECLQPFDELSYLDFYTGLGYPNEVELYPGLIGSIPHHPILEKLVAEISNITQDDIYRLGVHAATSSYLFTRIFFDIVTEYKEGIVALPPDYFYPFPNHKGHEKEDGRKYIKPCSFAIHYWAVSWSPSTKDVGGVDWIQGDKFVQIADYVYAPQQKASDDYAKYPNTFDPTNLKEVNIVFTCTMYLARLLRILTNLPQKFVVLSHNGDQHTEDGIIGTYANGIRIAEEPYALSDNILKMYVQNVDVRHPRISTLPLGLENAMWGDTKKTIMVLLKQKIKKGTVRRDKFVYMNHSLNTRREERTMVYEKFGALPWVTNAKPSKDLQVYFQSIAEHKFILNPWGNCFDNHRMWEAWYLGCIPITRRCIFTSFYEDFPICLIDSWDEVTEEFLNKEYDRIQGMNFNEDKLKFAYWRNKVRTIR